MPAFPLEPSRGIVLVYGPSTMPSKRRTHRIEKLARIYDDEILPVWAQRFGRMLLRDLQIPEKSQVLDVACGTGYPATELIRRMGQGSRLIAIDGSSAMLDVARKKFERLKASNVFFRSESAEPKLSFADDVYDMVFCNLGITEMADPAKALADFARVTTPGGQVRVTLPVAGSFDEFFDIYREVLVKHDKAATLEQLDSHVAETYPSAEACEAWLRDAGLVDLRVDIEEFTMLFKSSREFFFAPVIEYGPLTEWKSIAGAGQDLQDVFWYIKESIDAYFEGRAFQVTIKAACLSGTKPIETSDSVGDKTDVKHVAEVQGAQQTEDVDLDDFSITEGSMITEDGEITDGETGGDTAEDTAEGNTTQDQNRKVQASISRDEEGTLIPDTLNPATMDFGSTLENLPYIRPLGDVDDTHQGSPLSFPLDPGEDD